MLILSETGCTFAIILSDCLWAPLRVRACKHTLSHPLSACIGPSVRLGLNDAVRSLGDWGAYRRGLD